MTQDGREARARGPHRRARNGPVRPPSWGSVEAAGEASLAEIAENLHRAELTALERDEHIAEWVRLTEEKAKAAGSEEKPGQLAQVSTKGGRGKKSGISAASRDLGLERTQVRRAIKVAGITPDAKEAALASRARARRRATNFCTRCGRARVCACAREGGGPRRLRHNI